MTKLTDMNNLYPDGCVYSAHVVDDYLLILSVNLDTR